MKGIDGEKLKRCVSELDDKLVIVEGAKDSRSLKSLGVKNIMQLGGMPLAEFTFHVSRSITTLNDPEVREVVILTDFDSEGKRIAAKLELLLKKHKIAVNTRMRKRFAQFGKSCIEGFKEGDIYGKIGANVNKVRGKGHDKGKRSN